MIVDHYIRHNAVSRVPHRWVFLDCEAKRAWQGEAEIQTMRLAVTAFDRSDTKDGNWAETRWDSHYDCKQLWAWIDGCTRSKARTVVVAHNAGYDLRVSDAVRQLAALGWTMHRVSVSDRGISATWRRAGRTLAVVDSMSWLPVGLERVGGLVSTVKPPLPSDDDPDSCWLDRCRADVQILRRAYLDLIDWIRADDLGNWQRTGAGMAWSNWRHRHYTHRVLVHSDVEAQAAETSAIYTGRCEAWRHGNLERGPWVEWDLPLAYPRVARDVQVPVKLLAHRQAPSWRWCAHTMQSHRLLIRADVETPAPTLPTYHDGRILWPTGALSGWWWDTELANAVAYGAEIRPIECYDYRAMPALRQWAEWIIDYVENSPEGSTPVRQLAAKHMARALIGKFATRYTEWVPNGAPFPGCLPLETIFDRDNGVEGDVLNIGDQSFVGFERKYVADAVPSIMGAIMAEARVRLWRLMQLAGLENVAYVDTDSLLVNGAGTSRLVLSWAAGETWDARVTGEHNKVTVYGPRQLVLSGTAKIAGLPRNAEWVTGDTWAGDRWETFTTGMKRGHSDRVIIRPASFTLRGTDRRRRHLPDGSTDSIPLGAAQEAAQGA